MVIHAPEEEKVTTVIEMASKMKDTGRHQAWGSREAQGTAPHGRADCARSVSGGEGKTSF